MAIPMGVLEPRVAEFAPLAVAIEAALVGSAILAVGVARGSRRWHLLAVAAVSLPVVVGAALTPILESLHLYSDGDSWQAGHFGYLALLAAALFLATPRKEIA